MLWLFPVALLKQQVATLNKKLYVIIIVQQFPLNIRSHSQYLAVRLKFNLSWWLLDYENMGSFAGTLFDMECSTDSQSAYNEMWRYRIAQDMWFILFFE